MNTDDKSLHWLVDKWLAPSPAMPARVTQFSRTHCSQGRHVRVEASRPSGPLAIDFFRHDDGSWCGFRPRPNGQRWALAFAPGDARPGYAPLPYLGDVRTVPVSRAMRGPLPLRGVHLRSTICVRPVARRRTP
jgi:hypothetical protein